MAIARSTRELVRYVPEAERTLPAEQQTTFLLAVLPNHLMLAMLEMTQRGRTQAWIELALSAGLRGWENFKDADGRDAPFAIESAPRVIHGVDVKRPASAASLEVIPTGLLVELANAIVAANRVTVDDAKN